MPKLKLHPTRERRIKQEIVVDVYTSDERAIGWHCYLDDKLRFPFKAKCLAVREISPLKKGEEVEVLGGARHGAGGRLHGRDVRSRAVPVTDD